MSFTTRPELLGTVGMVASTHWLASAAGMAILERGGNAFDAAVAAGLTLHVVEPHLNGLGGDVPIIAWRAEDDDPFVVCGQGVSPATATPEAFRQVGLELVPGTGHLAAVVPGAFGAWLRMLAEHGTMTFAEVAAPAIHYARDGFPVVPQIAASIRSVEKMFRSAWPTSKELYLPNDEVPAPGKLFRNPDLARTLDRLAAAGKAAGGDRENQIEAVRKAFYEGFVAEAIDAYVKQPVLDSSGREHAGLLTADDLAEWRASVERPTSVDFYGNTVYKTGPWGQGPVLLQQLAMLQAADVTRLAARSPELVHLVTEVAKLAFADREAFYGDPDRVDVPLEKLLSAEYAAERVASIGEYASEELVPGLGGRLPHFALHPTAVGAAAGAGEPTRGPAPDASAPIIDRDGSTRGDTCHLDVVDRWGNVVSATPSGGWLMSSPVIPELGFALPTRAQMFWLEEGLPSTLAPRTRPRTTLSPGMLRTRDGGRVSFGTPGGDQQDQWVVPFLLEHLLFGADLQHAIDAPSWHSTHMPSSFYPRGREHLGLHVESRLGESVLSELRRRGHEVEDAGEWALGRISAAGRRADGVLMAAANPRGMQGYAVGR